MEKIILPERINYVGVFLSLRCNLNCPYCLNHQGEFTSTKEMSGADWIKALSRIETREDLPITLQGGEPTIHRSFYKIASNLHGKKLDLLTNGKFNVNEFMGHIHSGIFRRKAPYASIRFSHHKGLNDKYLIDKVGQLQSNGYSVGVWGFDINDNTEMKRFCDDNKIDYRVKEFLDEGKGTYKYPEYMTGEIDECMCRPSELLIAPDGKIYRCHRDLYAGQGAYAHILDNEVEVLDDFKLCIKPKCNRCDQKIKTNRLQIGGHCSVEIKEC